MKISNLRVESIEGNQAALFEIDGVECLEWVNLSFDECHYIPERTDSHLKSHCDSNYDVDDILDLLTYQLESYKLGYE